MPTALRESLLLICGVLLGIVVGAAIILFLHLDPDRKEAPSAQVSGDAAASSSTSRMGAGPAPAARAQATGPSSPAAVPAGITAAAATTSAPRVTCPVRPLLAAAGPKDGQLLPPADVAGKGLDEAERLLTTGKEAAAAGLVRDAEVALLTSCRIADARKGAGSVEAATARYQVARHYAGLAAAQGNAPAPEREELRRRAQAFYADSLQSFRTVLGPEHEKTRFAAEGLAALQRPVDGASPAAPPTAAAPPPVAPSPATTAASPAAPVAPAAPPPATAAAPSPRTIPPVAPVTREPAVARNPVPAPAAERPRAAVPARDSNATRPPAEPRVRQATGQPNVSLGSQAPADPARPSFDCAKARSTSEKIICGDAELSRLDRDLGRLHARAKDAAPDPSAFRRQNDSEWRRREANCRDRDCLIDWYAQRRRQLQASLGESSARRGQETAAR
jgi:hypothetical protein